MEEKMLLEWKESHAEVYAKFKEDLEGQLLKPYHQTILDLGDGNAESLQSVIAPLLGRARDLHPLVMPMSGEYAKVAQISQQD